MAGKHDDRMKEVKDAFGEGRSKGAEKIKRSDISDTAAEIDAERVDRVDLGMPEHRVEIGEREEEGKKKT